MFFEIVVASAITGKHIFATHERSLTNEEEAYDVFSLLKEKFPESEGYKIQVTKHLNAGEFMKWQGADWPGKQ